MYCFDFAAYPKVCLDEIVKNRTIWLWTCLPCFSLYFIFTCLLFCRTYVNYASLSVSAESRSMISSLISVPGSLSAVKVNADFQAKPRAAWFATCKIQIFVVKQKTYNQFFGIWLIAFPWFGNLNTSSMF